MVAEWLFRPLAGGILRINPFIPLGSDTNTHKNEKKKKWKKEKEFSGGIYSIMAERMCLLVGYCLAHSQTHRDIEERT